MSLSLAFAGLPAAAAANPEEFNVVPAGSGNSYFLGKDAASDPVLLCSLEGSTSAILPTVELQHLTVRHRVPCIVLDAATHSRVEGDYSVIRCHGGDALTRLFLDAIDGLIRALGSGPTAFAISERIAQLVELFRALNEPPRTTVQGLWAELFVIARAADASLAVSNWHAEPSETYDLQHGAERLEVKTTSPRVRQHHFSLAQLNPPAGATVVVVSVLTQTATGGVSIRMLAEEIRLRIGRVEDGDRLLTNIAKSLGTSWVRAIDLGYDRELADESIRFFLATDIPRIDPDDIPSGVSEVGFASNLDDAPFLTSEDHAALGPFHRNFR